MTKFTPILAAGAAAIAALGLTVPAQAASYNGERNYRGERGYNNLRATLPPIAQRELRQELWQLDNQINRAVRNHRISWRDARYLDRQLQRAKNNYYRFARGGMSYREKMIVERQLRDVRYQLRQARFAYRSDGRRGYGQGRYSYNGAYNGRGR